MQCISTVSKYVWEISHSLLPSIRAVSHIRHERLKRFASIQFVLRCTVDASSMSPFSRAAAGGVAQARCTNGREAHEIFPRRRDQRAERKERGSQGRCRSTRGAIKTNG